MLTLCGIVNFVSNPDLYNGKDISKLETQVVNAVKTKIDNLEKKYNIKISFPKNICSMTSVNKPNLPIFITPQFNNGSIEMLVPITSIISESTPDTQIENISRCMRIVNSIKQDLEDYSAGRKTKEQVDNTFFTWNSQLMPVPTPTPTPTPTPVPAMPVPTPIAKTEKDSKVLLRQLLEDMTKPDLI